MQYKRGEASLYPLKMAFIRPILSGSVAPSKFYLSELYGTRGCSAALYTTAECAGEEIVFKLETILLLPSNVQTCSQHTE